METLLSLSLILNRILLFLCKSSICLVLENVALRKQLALLNSRIPKIRTKPIERWYFILFSKLFSKWQDIIVIVQPKTVLAWHKNFIWAFWKWISRTKPSGRPATDKEMISLIHRMAKENPLWTARKICNELDALGFDVSLNTVRKYLPRKKRAPSPSWKSFLSSHFGEICAMDFFTVPCIRNLRSPFFCFFIISHATREILHVNITRSPDLLWVKQQIRQAFETDIPKWLLSDNDPVFKALKDWLKEVLGTSSVFTARRSPWQNPYAERWVRTCREELSNHIIPLGENHLLGLLKEYVEYYNQDRRHMSLNKSPPIHRKRQSRKNGQVLVALPRVSGLYHRYEWRDAA